MNKISTASHKFSILFKWLLVIYPIFNIAIWLGAISIPPGYCSIMRLTTSIDLSKVALELRVYACLVYMLPTLIVSLGFYYLHKLFDLYAQGVIFSQLSIAYIRKIGYTMFWQVITTICVHPFITMILTADALPGMHILEIGFAGEDVSNLTIAGIVILISWIMNEGRKLEDEAALTV